MFCGHVPLVALGAERRLLLHLGTAFRHELRRDALPGRLWGLVELVGVDVGVGAVRRRGLRRRAAPISHRAGIAVERRGDAGGLGLGQARRKLDVEAHDEAAPEVALVRGQP